MKERNLIAVILLSLLTFGVYYPIWQTSVWREAARQRGDPEKATAWLVPALALIAGSLAMSVVWAVRYFDFVRSNPSSDEMVDFYVENLVLLGIMMAIGLAYAAINAFLMWKAASSVQNLMADQGRKPAIPAIVHAIVPIFLNIWTLVAVIMVSMDANSVKSEA